MTLKRRSQFLAAAKSVYAPRKTLVLQGVPAERVGLGPVEIGVGFTATKKIGGAVTRNRAKRRLREIARAVLPENGRPGTAYVLIARLETPTCDWSALLDDAKAALQTVHARLDRAKRPSSDGR